MVGGGKEGEGRKRIGKGREGKEERLVKRESGKVGEEGGRGVGGGIYGKIFPLMYSLTMKEMKWKGPC